MFDFMKKLTMALENMKPRSTISYICFVAIGSAHIAVAASVLSSGGGAPLTTTVGDAIAEMHIPHAAAPYGVPSSYDWQKGPVVQAGNRPPQSFRALTGWGQVYRVAGAAPVSRTVLLRNFRTYILTRAGELQLVQSPSSLTGSMFDADYKNNKNTKAEIKIDPSGITSIVTNADKSFQFWPAAGKTQFDPHTLRGVVVAVEAKLVSENEGDGDVNGKGDYILSVGGDYWLATNSKWDNYRSSAGIATGRFSYITTSWKCFTMTTIDDADASIIKSKFKC
ncbi:hypothetical protein [Paraburkholderia fungorum]|nr:hypothetical protein [Paraburkholderia fungorum]